jgi:uncharacterized cupin superfamily protein
MSTTDALYVVERVGGGGYEPFVIDGVQVGEYRRIRPKGRGADTLDAGLWRSEPANYDYFFATDEAFYVLDGAVTIELPDSGETLDLRTGDIGYFKASTRSVWTISERFKKFVVVPAVERS